MNILLVDDEILVLEGLKTVVLKVLPNASVNAFNKVEPAIKFARENKVDIAFLDINMRIMNGLEMAKVLQEIYPNINIIFVTGYDEFALEAFDIFASAYLTKPVSEEAVLSAVENLRYKITEKMI